VSAPPASFYFDLQSPLAYLAAERILHVLPGPAEWQPVLAGELPGGEPYDAFRCEEEQDIFRAALARRATELRVQPLRWPDPFPYDSSLAMRVATYAKSIGRVVPFAQAAFRQAFAGARNLQDPDNVLIAAAACEMHPAAVLRGGALRSVGVQLADATAGAIRAGIIKIPAIVVGDVVYEGERALEQAAAQMAAGAAPSSEVR
jgi:2-hydroxychromene-2-carboxylate isomerase